MSLLTPSHYEYKLKEAVKKAIADLHPVIEDEHIPVYQDRTLYQIKKALLKVLDETKRDGEEKVVIPDCTMKSADREICHAFNNGKCMHSFNQHNQD